MAYRNLMVASPAKISVRQEQLIVSTEQEYSIPLEDIAAVLIESRQTTLSAAALAALAQQGIAVFFCDEKHLPCGVLQPFSQHSRGSEVQTSQLAMTEPAKKRLWQQIVMQKIQNQAECLSLCGKEREAVALYTSAAAVTSGDKENREATAAARYFPALFGADFTRGEEGDTRNAALNYGYAILRGQMARSLAVYGFLPAFGLHHASGLNQYNLADDLMEPFRPIVDLYVAGNVKEDAALTTMLKGQLFNLLNVDTLVGGRHYTAAYACELTVQSLQGCIQGRGKALLLPKLLMTRQHRQHRYE